MSERATVVMLHGSGSERLRQALGQGLVRKEIQADIESALAEADQAKEWCDTLSQQNYELQNQLYYTQDQNRILQQQNAQLFEEMKKKTHNYEIALKAEQERQNRKKERRDTLTFLLTAGVLFLGAVASVYCALVLFYVTWYR